MVLILQGWAKTFAVIANQWAGVTGCGCNHTAYTTPGIPHLISQSHYWLYHTGNYVCFIDMRSCKA